MDNETTKSPFSALRSGATDRGVQDLARLMHEPDADPYRLVLNLYNFEQERPDLLSGLTSARLEELRLIKMKLDRHIEDDLKKRGIVLDYPPHPEDGEDVSHRDHLDSLWRVLERVPKAVIAAGLKEAVGEYLGWTHGDMQTPVQDALKALKIIETERSPRKIFLKGQRIGRPFFDRFFTAGMSIFESALFGITLRDINAQPNIFHRSLMEGFFNPPNDFSLDLYAHHLAKINGFVIKRFPVSFLPRPHGESHWNPALS